MPSKSYCYEVVTCRGREGLDSGQVVNALRGVQDWLSAQPGFVARKLLQTEDGAFVDFVTWQSAAHAHQAAQSFAAAPCAAQVMGVLDETSVRMVHARALELG